MRLRAATVTDGYKVNHAPMYADGTQKVYSNLTARTDRIFRRNCTSFYGGKLVWVGGQGAVQEIQELWDDSFFNIQRDVAVGRFKQRIAGYLGCEILATKLLAELWDHSYLPLEFKSLPEGSRVPFGVPLLTVTETLPQFYWLTNYLETLISDLMWKPTTVATIADEFKAICNYYAGLTGTDDFSVSIQCHDFSMRGMSGPEDAARSGFGHLLSFIGTDTLPAMDYAEDYYDADPNSLIAISVPATEHAVSTSNILAIETVVDGNAHKNPRLVSEQLFMEDLITRKFPTGIISYVADSFDYWSVLTDVLPALKDVILAREASNGAPGKLVIRPDSGDPVKVITGYTWSGREYADAEELKQASHKQFYAQGDEWGGWKSDDDIDKEVVKIAGVFYEAHLDGHNYVRPSHVVVPEVEVKGSIQLLWEIFGGTETEKGFKLLDSHIGLIYGDSITTQRAEQILQRLLDKGFASGNVVFGVGSYTYQFITRDTFGMAIKATYTVVDNVPVSIFKAPKTDARKASAKGLLFVGKDAQGEFYLVDDVSPDQEASEGNYLKTFWKNGQFTNRVTLVEIRDRVAAK